MTPIKHVLFLDPYESLMAIDNSGEVLFYSLTSFKLKYKLLLCKNYQTESMTNVMDNFPVTAVRFSSEINGIILGD